MIGSLRGQLIEKQPPEILVEVGGVGYEIQMPMSCFFNLPPVGSEIKIVTHFVVREDAQLLFGFNTKNERALFRELIKINGVGPKLGLGILSSMDGVEFITCIENKDAVSLTKLPGIGKKTAERLIIELEDRLKGWLEEHDAVNVTTTNQENNFAKPCLNAKAEAVSALLALGYKEVLATKMINKIYKAAMSNEELIKAALKAAL